MTERVGRSPHGGGAFGAVRIATFLVALLLVACSDGTTGTTSVAPSTAPGPSVPVLPTDGDPAAAAERQDVVEFGFGEGSEVRFLVDEELRGTPVTVVGVNTSVTGTFLVDTTDPARTDGGRVTIVAADFVTDEDRRNGALDRFILDVDAHPLITFDIVSLSESRVVGVLTIREVAHEVTFDVALEGDGTGYVLSGSAVVDRTAWGITIPSVPFVANVSEDVTLEFDFVLEPVA